MSEFDEVVDHEPSAEEVVVDHGVEVLTRAVKGHGHCGYTSGEVFDPCRVKPGGDEDQAVHPTVQQRLDAPLLTVGRCGPGGDDDFLEGRAPELVTDALRHLRLER
jgi:hypothetical protein